MKRRAAILAAASLFGTSALAEAPAVPDVYTRPDKGNCISCHQLPEGVGHGGGGNVGPALAGERMRQLGATGLQAVLDDPLRANPRTLMPPYGRHRILEAAEMGTLVKFLQALPDGAPAPAAEPDPPAADGSPALIERGRILWLRKFKDRRSLASCFPNGGRRVAATYPQYDARLKRVITLEMAINQCLKAHHEKSLDPLDADTMGVIVAYVRSLADGQKINVRVPAAAQNRFEEGRRLYFTRMGQRNFACASCHVQAAGKRYGDAVLTPAQGQAARAQIIRDGKAVTLQARMRACLERMGAAPFPAGSDELNHLEYFLTYLSNGLAIEARPSRPAPNRP